MIDRTTPPPVQTITDLHLPELATKHLANGVTLNYISGGSQDVCELVIMWQGGHGDASQITVSKLVAALMTEGTQKYSGAEISEALDFNGARLKIYPTHQYTVLSVTVLNNKIEAVLPVLEQIILYPTFSEDKFIKLRDVEAQNENFMMSYVMSIAAREMTRQVCGEEYFLKYNTDPKRIMQVTRDEVVDFHSRMITAQKCQAFLAGKIDEKLLALVSGFLEILPADKPPIELSNVPMVPQTPQRVDIDKPGAVQAAVAISWPGPARDDPDYVPLNFTVEALGGYFGSRLMKNIREDKGYTYGINSMLIGNSDGSFIAIIAQADQNYVDLLIQEVKHEIDKLAHEPMGDDEMLRLKQDLSNILINIIETPMSIIDYYRSALATAMPKSYFSDRVDWLKRLDTDTIMEMTRKYLKPEQMRIAVCK